MFKSLKFIFGKKIDRIRKNIFANLFELILSTIYQILLIPLMIYSWGIQLYGVWIFLVSIPYTLSTLNIDISEGVSQQLILNKNKKDKYLNELFSNSLICTLINCLIFYSFYSSLYSFFGSNFETLKIFNNSDLNLIIILIAFWYCIELIIKNIHAGISINGSLNIVTYLDAYFRFIPGILIAFLGLISKNLLFAALILIFFSIIKLLISIFFLKKLTSLKIKFSTVRFQIIKKIYLISKSYYLNSLSNSFYLSGFNFIIGVFYSAEILSMFYSLNTLFRWSISKLTGVFLLTLRFEYANFFSQKLYSKIKELFLFQLRFLFIILFLYLVFCIFFGEYFYNLFTLNVYKDFKTLMIVLVIENIIYIFSNTYLIFLKSLNRFFQVSILDVILSVILFFLILIISKNQINLVYLIYILIIRSLILLFFNRYVVLKMFKNFDRKYD